MAAGPPWLALDADDNDMARFLSYLIAAVAAARPGFGRAALALVRSPQPVAAQTVLTYLLQEVSAFEQTLVLALDDYHVITAQPIYDGLAFLLDHLPEQLRLVIVTRTDCWSVCVRCQSGHGRTTSPHRPSELTVTTGRHMILESSGSSA